MKLTLFQGIFLGVFVLAAIIGIFVFATIQGGGTQQAKIGTVVIWGTLSKDAMTNVLLTASQQNQDLKSVSYVQKNSANFKNDLISAIAQGTAPDLVLLSHEDLLSVSKIIQTIDTATLSERTFRDAFASGSEIYLVPNSGGAFGLPFLIDPLVLYQNRAILSSSGIAAAPSTWEGLTGLASRIVSKTAANNISRALIAFGTYANVHNARAVLSALFLQTGVPLSVLSSINVVAADLGSSSNGGAPLGQSVLRFYTQFADPSKLSYTWNASLPDSQARFLTGDLALYVGFASEAPYLTEANPNLDYDVSELPQLSTSGVKTTFGNFYAFAIPRGSKNPTGAYAAASALTDPTLDALAAKLTSMAPADRASLSSPPGTTVGAVAYSSALFARAWLSPAPSATDQVFSTMINNVISGRQTIDAALASAEGALSALLQQ